MKAERFEFKVHYDKPGYEAVVSVPADANIEKVVDAFSAFLLAAGFEAKTVNWALGN